jgi:hypothetical protein
VACHGPLGTLGSVSEIDGGFGFQAEDGGFFVLSNSVEKHVSTRSWGG